MPERRKLDVVVWKGTGRATREVQYTRTITAKPVTFTCQDCQQVETRQQLPGPAPRYCDTCREQRERARNAAKQRQRRERQRQKGS